MSKFVEGLREFFSGRFSLEDDNATQDEVESRIRGAVVIKGTNLWVLIFATFIASIGLNVNSTAVIIGAMLISPLMGPIMGMGMSLGINDFELLKRSLKNFGFMMLISIVTSTVYFMISPLSSSQEELLARTQPTTLDVFIALFGGLAGIVAMTRKDKTSTVIPGVAIATALMPPLCTAGFGLATGQFNYFFGAFYLFIINTVFIAIGTFLIINFLKYNKKQFSDPKRGKKVTRIMSAIIFITITPSVFIGYNLVQTSIFEQNVSKYISKSFVFEDTRVVDYNTSYNRGQNKDNGIEVVLFGAPLSNDVIEVLRSQMPQYGITHTKLVVRQSSNSTDLASSFIQTNFEELLQEKNDKISKLESQIKEHDNTVLPTGDISQELSALFDVPVSVALSYSTIFDASGIGKQRVLICYIKYDSEMKLNAAQRTRLEEFLKIRTKIDSVKFIFENE